MHTVLMSALEGDVAAPVFWASSVITVGDETAKIPAGTDTTDPVVATTCSSADPARRA